MLAIRNSVPLVPTRRLPPTRERSAMTDADVTVLPAPRLPSSQRQAERPESFHVLYSEVSHSQVDTPFAY